MAYTVDNPTIFLALSILLVLSIVTVEICRRDRVSPRAHTDRFLFGGKSFLYSFVSNVGAIFSVTYFFGATFIYASILGSWSLVIVATGFITASLLIMRILKVIHSRLTHAESTGQNSNILLLFMEKSEPAKEHRLFLHGLALIYFALLVEELAVSRLILNTLFPSHLAVSALLITIITLVIYAYISIGGFRAVLNSDFVQGVVLSAFLLVLVYFIFGGPESASNPEPSADSHETPVILVIVLFSLLLTAWLTTSVDAYSRLNFRVSPKSALRFRRRFVLLSLFSTLLVLIVGILFAVSVSGTIGEIRSPVEYTHKAVSLFLSAENRVVTTVFLVSLFCMMFTTIDTLLLTMLQLGHHMHSRRLRRRNLSLVLLAGIVGSAGLSHNAVSAVGIFIASLLILPFTTILRTCFPLIKYVFPKSNYYYYPSVLVAVVVFAVFYYDLETEFTQHYLIPGMVAGATIMSMAVAKAIELSSDS